MLDIITSGLFIIFIYFLPTILAVSRKHKNAYAIWLLNFFLGWTFIFWVLALVWASLNSQKESTKET
ncbi:superinfection immunity protein [Natranaerofaba carboxydovora]|uniref:superinfection immunity protein n=1 Tax=Natranaerofaba carboxydovora TaxID=2742683 RepID=UPI001F13BB0D|nr:superinfection immunity protein [Natranaerofaba carboxydovora]UMZ72551.1 Superinfection immunity protein [Natranaerofaba carboxydovora]